MFRKNGEALGRKEKQNHCVRSRALEYTASLFALDWVFEKLSIYIVMNGKEADEKDGEGLEKKGCLVFEVLT